MHALKFRFMTPSGRPSGWLYVRATRGCAPTAATHQVREARLKHRMRWPHPIDLRSSGLL